MTPAEILAAVARWPPALAEEWSERAALVAEGCRVDRETSERIAYEQMKNRAPMKQAALTLEGR